MDDYFKELQKNIPDQVASEKSHIDDMAFLTVHSDIDCELFCDGESLCQLKANKVQKVSVSLGNHMLSVESDKNKDFVKHYSVQYTQKEENNLFSINLKQEEDNYLQNLGIERSMEEDFQQKLNEKDELISKFKSEIAKYKNNIENLKDTLASERKSYSLQLRTKEKEISTLKLENSKLKDALNDPYQKACEDLESKHWEEMGKKEKEIFEIRAKCQKEIDNCKSKASSDLADKEKEIFEIKAKCQKEIDDCKSKTSSDLADKEKEHISEIDEMRREFKLFKERIKKEIQDRDNEILKLQSEKGNTDGGLFNKLFKK